MEWLFLKVFFGSSAEFGRDILLDCLYPQAQNLLAAQQIEKFFYLYYGEGGNHIRFRLLGKSDQLIRYVRPALETALQRYAANHSDGVYPTWEYAVYEPEFFKYGGEKGMPLAESHFQTSSEAAVAVQTAVRRQQLNTQYALIVLIEELAKAFGYQTAANRMVLYASCRNYWLQTFLANGQDTWQAYFEQRGERAIKTVSSIFRANTHPAELAAILPWWQCKAEENFYQLTEQVAPERIPLMVQNYIHMLHNRVGLSIPQEAFLLHLLTRTHQKNFNLEDNYAADFIFFQPHSTAAY